MTSLKQQLAAARRHRQAGRRAQAQAAYERILKTDPRQPDALEFFGLEEFAAGRFAEAAQQLEQAVSAAPSSATLRANLGAALQSCGRLDEAIACYRRALAIKPNLPQAHNNLAAALKRQGQLAEAEEHYRRAIVLKPDYHEAYSNLGNLLQELRRIDEALAAQQTALRLDPNYAEGHNNHGLALAAAGRLDEAAAEYREAIRLKPHYDEAHDNLGSALRSLGQTAEALACYQRAIELNPNLAGAHNNLGALLQAEMRVHEAVACYRRAVELDPENATTRANLGDALAELGDFHAAQEHYRRAIATKPTNRLRLVLATQLPPIYESLADVQAWRERLHESLEVERLPGLALDPNIETLPSLFYLAYQGYDVRGVMESIARCYQPADDPPLARGPGEAPDRRIHVGFISRLFKNHTIGRLMQGFIAQLPRERFAVTVVTHGHHRDGLANQIRSHADRCVEIPDHLPTARQRIVDQQLDVLFYADVGMDPVTSSLAYSRLAPVQCVTWGHPVTSASPHIDYFVSSEHIEPRGAEEHYTERLAALPRLPTYYERPQIAGSSATRNEYGLPEDGRVYLCPQSLFKFHPEFDPLLAEILRRDSQGVLGLIRGPHATWTERLTARFQRTMPDVVDRIVWLPRLAPESFVALLAKADVMLDPLHFGGGNTTYEAIAAALPIITLPSGFMRGRVTLGCYRQMGLLNCVAHDAEEYVQLAIRVAQDEAFSHHVREQLAARRTELFADRGAIDVLAKFLTDAVQTACGTPIIPKTTGNWHVDSPTTDHAH